MIRAERQVLLSLFAAPGGIQAELPHLDQDSVHIVPFRIQHAASDAELVHAHEVEERLEGELLEPELGVDRVTALVLLDQLHQRRNGS